MKPVDFSPLWFSPFRDCFVVHHEGEGNNREFSAILLRFEAGAIEVVALPDTDELQIQLHTDSDIPLRSKAYVHYALPAFGDRLSYAWQCLNLNGYEDLFVLSFKDLQPQLGIYCMGSSLSLLSLDKI